MALTKVTNDLLALGESTSSLNLPKGTTAQRPSSPVAGMVRENTDDNVIEYYNGTELKQVLTQEPPILVDYLIVSGGGSGGSDLAGGGGSSLIYRQGFKIKLNTVYSITVGAGGSGTYPGSNGFSSSFNSSTSTPGDVGDTLRSGFGGDGQKIVKSILY